MHYQLTDSFEVAADIERVWDFFSNARNLPVITPPWLSFTIDTPGEITMTSDTLLDYTIRWNGLPIKWRTRIIDWTPQRQFIDLQLKGPYTLWHHQHTFAPTPGGVHCTDRVIYKLPMGWLGRIAHFAMVRRQLMGIFRFRRTAIAQHLGAIKPLQNDVMIDCLK